MIGEAASIHRFQKMQLTHSMQYTFHVYISQNIKPFFRLKCFTGFIVSWVLTRTGRLRLIRHRKRRRRGQRIPRFLIPSSHFVTKLHVLFHKAFKFMRLHYEFLKVQNDTWNQRSILLCQNGAAAFIELRKEQTQQTTKKIFLNSPYGSFRLKTLFDLFSKKVEFEITVLSDYTLIFRASGRKNHHTAC